MKKQVYRFCLTALSAALLAAAPQLVQAADTGSESSSSSAAQSSSSSNTQAAGAGSSSQASSTSASSQSNQTNGGASSSSSTEGHTTTTTHTEPNKPAKPKLTGTPFTGTIHYVPHYSVAVWNHIEDAKATMSHEKLANGSRWHVYGYAKGANGEDYASLGGDQWVQARYISAKPLAPKAAGTKTHGRAYVAYVAGYGIAVRKTPNGAITGKKLADGTKWAVSRVSGYGSQRWYDLGGNQWVSGKDLVVLDSTYPASVHLNVPLIAQRPELPNGCEITAVTMMVNYAGDHVSKMTLAREMPRSSDPNKGYIGNPAGAGITIFPPALMHLVRAHVGSAKNLTGMGMDAIYYQLSLGHPVVTWHTMHGFPYHALTVTGYDKNYIYYNDCWTDARQRMTHSEFLNNWRTQNERAISY